MVTGICARAPGRDDDALWSALVEKTAAMRERGLVAVVTTQFGFATAAVLERLTEARRRGVDAPVRIGVPARRGSGACSATRAASAWSPRRGSSRSAASR